MAQVQPLEAAAGRPLTSSSRSAPHDKASINHSLLHNHSYKKAQARIDRKLQAGSLRHPTFGTSHGHKKAESERRQRTKKALAEAIHYLMFLTLVTVIALWNNDEALERFQITNAIEEQLFRDELDYDVHNAMCASAVDSVVRGEAFILPPFAPFNVTTLLQYAVLLVERAVNGSCIEPSPDFLFAPP